MCVWVWVVLCAVWCSRMRLVLLVTMFGVLFDVCVWVCVCVRVCGFMCVQSVAGVASNDVRCVVC